MSAQDDANAAASLIALVNATGGPRRVQGDAGTVEMYSLADLIKAQQYLASVAAASLKNRGLRFNRLTPPGMVGRRAGELGTGTGNAGGWGISGGYPG